MLRPTASRSRYEGGAPRNPPKLSVPDHLTARRRGKGRKERRTPLAEHVRNAPQAWLREPAHYGSSLLFPNMHGEASVPTQSSFSS